MTNSRDQLKQALSDIICASIKRDRPDAAEKVLAAMEKHFVPRTSPFKAEPPEPAGKRKVTWETVQADINAMIRANHYLPFAPEIDKIGCFVPWEIPPLLGKDPDVAELLKAIERRDEAIIAFGADSQQASMAYSTMRGAYRKVRQKYE